MATLISDEKDVLSGGGGMVIGKVEFLPTGAKIPPTIRSISSLAIEKHRKARRDAQEAASIFGDPMTGKTTLNPVPTIPTVAPCEFCLTRKRCGQSPLCADCLHARQPRNGRSFLDREVTGRDFLLLCAILGLLLVFVVQYASQK